MPLSQQEQQEISRLLRTFELDTGVQAVAAVVAKADAYPELPWRAYALGSALGALSVLVMPHLVGDWTSAYTIAVQAMAVLGTGAAFAAAAALIPPVGRMFLDHLRAEAEARQYALGMFLDRELFHTPDRRAVLVLVARFERVAVIVADTGLAGYAPPGDRELIAREMRDVIRQGGIAPAFERAFTRLRVLFAERGLQPAQPPNALADEIVAEKGA